MHNKFSHVFYKIANNVVNWIHINAKYAILTLIFPIIYNSAFALMNKFVSHQIQIVQLIIVLLVIPIILINNIAYNANKIILKITINKIANLSY